MKHLFLSVIFMLPVLGTSAQTYQDAIHRHRQTYKEEFITDRHSPLKPADTSFLRFYEPDSSFRIIAKVKHTPEARSFKIPTHSGKEKNYRKYGELTFSLHQKEYTLEVYQSIDLLKDTAYKNYLFLPFNDLTNYETTYAGGRYLDLSIGDIKDDNLVLDFNKCYNPYCAYADGYSCPIPPDANKLQIAIKAGEQMFGRPVEDH